MEVIDVHNGSFRRSVLFISETEFKDVEWLDVLTAYYRYQPEEVSVDGKTPRLDFILKFYSLKRGYLQALSLTYPHLNIKVKKKE